MIRFIDTHIHLDGEEYDADRQQVVSRAVASGAEMLFVPGINLASVGTVKDVCATYPDVCRGMIGLHPEDVKADYREVLAELRTHLDDIPWIAIGEIGLDYYWSREFENEQQEAFEVQVEWGSERSLPLMIHSRKAQNDIVHILRGKQGVRGVFNCFTGNAHEAEELLSFDGFCLGIGGVLTFKKSNLPETLAAAVPLQRIVLETDAPYMAPVPHRGERNESSFIVNIINRLAEVYNVSPEEVAQVTTRTAKKMFQINELTN